MHLLVCKAPTWPICLPHARPQTKWAVSGTVFAVLLARRDLAAAWCVLGSIIASFINKVRQLTAGSHSCFCCPTARPLRLCTKSRDTVCGTHGTCAASNVCRCHTRTGFRLPPGSRRVHPLTLRVPLILYVSIVVRQALKYIINEQRPQNARKADPGMPSSHANSECCVKKQN